MTRLARRNAILSSVGMIAAAAAGQSLRPNVHVSEKWEKISLEEIYPHSFSEWRQDNSMPLVIPVPDTEALLKRIYSQTLARTYRSPNGLKIMLSVAYGGDQSDATRAHRPEVCYPAQGFQTSASSLGWVSIGKGRLKVRRLVAKLGPRVEPISYWIVVGNEAVVSGTEQKLAQIRFGIDGLIPDGTLVRVSSIDAAGAPVAFEHHSRFIADLFAAIAPSWRPRVFGSAV